MNVLNIVIIKVITSEYGLNKEYRQDDTSKWANNIHLLIYCQFIKKNCMINIEKEVHLYILYQPLVMLISESSGT